MRQSYFLLAIFRPAPKQAPRWVCIVSENESQRLADVGIDHRCKGSQHAHYQASKVDTMVAFGQLRWVGKHHKIATWVDHMAWAKVESGGYATMQLVRGLRR